MALVCAPLAIKGKDTSIAKEWKEEGREEGKEEGIEEGKYERKHKGI